MAGLLVTPTRLPDTDNFAQAAMAIRSQMQQDALRAKAEQRLQQAEQQQTIEHALANQRRQQEFEAKLAFDRQRDDRDFMRATALDDRAEAWRQRNYDAENAPFTFGAGVSDPVVTQTPGNFAASAVEGFQMGTGNSGGRVGFGASANPAPGFSAGASAAPGGGGFSFGSTTPTASVAPSTPSGRALATITDYGQSDDPFGDSLTRAGKSAIGQLTAQSMAFSPDMEQVARSKGIKIGQPVTLVMDDGQKVTRIWDDRTAQDSDVARGRVKGVSSPLRGRADLYSPGGPSPLRGRKVMDILPASSPAGEVRNFARELASMNTPGQPPVITRRDGAAILRSAAAAALRPRTAASQRPVAPVTRPFSDGTTRQYNDETGQWDVLAQKPETPKRENDLQKARIFQSQYSNLTNQIKDIDKQMAKAGPDVEEKWPYVGQDGGYYTADNTRLGDAKDKKAKQKYDAAMASAETTKQAKASRAELAARRAELKALADRAQAEANRLTGLDGSGNLPPPDAPNPPANPSMTAQRGNFSFGSTPSVAAPKPKQEPISRELAAQILREANGDKEKARAIARQRGLL